MGITIQALPFSRDEPTPSQRPTCSYFGRLSHDYEVCYRRVGFLENGTRGRGRGRQSRGRGGEFAGHTQPSTVTVNKAATPYNEANTSNSNSTPANIPGLSSNQIQRLLTLLYSSLASYKLTSKPTDNTWLLDSGASNHMTGTLDHIYERSNLPPCPMSLPDGEKSMSVLQVSVRLNSGLVLRHVLYVPNLQCNLISICQLFLMLLVK